jgi:D-alanyl-D-alanine carboxypeptidase
MPAAIRKPVFSRARALCAASALATIVVLALTGSPGAATAAQGSSDAALRAKLTSELDDYLRDRGAAEHISGASLRVTFPGSKPSINIPVGTTRYGGGEPLSKTNLWQIGSNTKAITSVMLLQLEAEHRLSIHDTVGQWLPRYRAWRHVTIKQLLEMKSGIPDYTHVPAFWSDYAADPNTEFSPRRLVSYAMRGQPTTGWYYSNTNYILAGMILHKATHDTYAHQLKKRIIKPLGLRTLTYSTKQYPRSFTDRLPAGYFFNATFPWMKPLLGQDIRRFNLSAPGTAGGIVSSLKDATKWERALYKGRMLPRKQQRELESLVSMNTGKPIERATPNDNGYGLGVGEEVLPVPGLGTVWAYEGQWLGYRLYHVYVPRSGALLAVATNSNPSDNALKEDLVEPVLRTLHRAGAA